MKRLIKLVSAAVLGCGLLVSSLHAGRLQFDYDYILNGNEKYSEIVIPASCSISVDTWAIPGYGYYIDNGGYNMGWTYQQGWAAVDVIIQSYNGYRLEAGCQMPGDRYQYEYGASTAGTYYVYAYGGAAGNGGNSGVHVVITW